jgi:flagellar hook-length control protein FliK
MGFTPVPAAGDASPSTANGADPDTGTGSAADLMDRLASALTELDQTEKQGKTPGKDLLGRVQDAVAALSGFIGTLQPATMIPAAPLASASTDSSASGSSAVSGVSALLASLNGSATDTGGTAAGDGTDDAAANGSAATAADAPSAQFADRIEALASALAPTQPSLAGDLDQLARQLQAGGSNAAAAAPARAAPQAAFLNAPAAAASLGATSLARNAGAAGTGDTPAPETSAAAPSQDAAAGTPASAPPAPPALLPTAHSSKVAPIESNATKNAAVAGKDAADKGPVAAAKTETAVSNASDPSDNPASASSPSGAATPQQPLHDAVNLAPPQPIVTAGSAIAQQAQGAYQPVDTAAVNLPQMAFDIVRHFQQGSNEFQIRLDPAELGRVDVKLAIDASGAVSAHLSAERPDTLNLLRRDASTLNQALTQAGLDGGKTNLQFSLSQNPFTRQDGNPQAGTGSPPASDGDGDTTAAAVLAPAITRYRGHAASSGLNIFV